MYKVLITQLESERERERERERGEGEGEREQNVFSSIPEQSMWILCSFCD